MGSFYEDMAVEYLNENGINIIDKNFSTKNGEIDLVGYDGDYLVFFEIKYRANEKYGHPFEAVDAKKQGHIRAAARYYLYSKHIGENVFLRFDCIGIVDDKIEWLKNAF